MRVEYICFLYFKDRDHICSFRIGFFKGTFRRTCESVIKVLRVNRDSVMAVLEAFVYDPLVYWKLVEATNAATNQTIQGPNFPNNNNIQQLANQK